jgi:hypothetical protein
VVTIKPLQSPITAQKFSFKTHVMVLLKSSSESLFERRIIMNIKNLSDQMLMQKTDLMVLLKTQTSLCFKGE